MSDSQIVLNVHFDAAAGHEDELAGLLSALVAPTRAEPGCRTYELHRDPENFGKFMFFEKFESQHALDAHIASPHFRRFQEYCASAEPDPVASVVVTRWRAIS